MTLKFCGSLHGSLSGASINGAHLPVKHGVSSHFSATLRRSVLLFKIYSEISVITHYISLFF